MKASKRNKDAVDMVTLSREKLSDWMKERAQYERNKWQDEETAMLLEEGARRILERGNYE